MLKSSKNDGFSKFDSKNDVLVIKEKSRMNVSSSLTIRVQILAISVREVYLSS